MDTMYPPPPFSGTWQQHLLPYLRRLAVPPLILIGFSLGFPTLLLQVSEASPSMNQSIAMTISTIITMGCGIFAVVYILWMVVGATEIRWMLHDDRIVETLTTGAGGRQSLYSVSYREICDVDVNWTAIGRRLGYATIVLYLYGEEPFCIRDTPRAQQLFEFFEEVVRRNKARERN